MGMEKSWVIPVVPKYKITNDAQQHLSRPDNLLAGIDFVSFSGSFDLLSVSTGIVEYTYTQYDPAHAYDGNYYDSLGRVIVVKYYAGAIPVWFRYCHNEEIDVVPLQTIGTGEVIGKYGYTGFCEPRYPVGAGRHLHLDAWCNPEDAEEARKMGLIPKSITAPERWPGGHVVTNVDYTNFFMNMGLDVVNSTK